ncbi:butyryl-CoA dehydrogenase [Nocardia sp. 852002-20019_SCH5090214]|uniref:acyl-CoA dehydrogenase n=1 Tax=Nocardia TaxID=1817 RepID=UPI0007EABDB7|nr:MULTISPECIES: acyl-CoA dehydrogenase [Nocardia]OBF68756.1 butyryl-CoA dehydrogenase [Mycobacterium sp. 852002-51759_SCH5129042]MBF6277797.1 acyl-CoA dehydrogenase [Nocardia nova]MBV7701178.1 acyl-CoA dehydrogenase [Nocardia nova]OBA43003.1 butyryl-CoA dehydrogenase [Nocardia sp. 852002-20019_SCH5090214]OBA52826.1 butyryl-CoA dehydrogenase [Nocardia sp. 852002-51101_SCH5132738]
MSHYKANLRDIEFNLFEVLGIGALLEAGAYGDLDTETARGMLTEVQRLAEGPVAESFVDADRNPISFDAAEHEVIVPDPLRKTVAAVNEAGWSGLGMPEDMGGVDAPSPLIWAIQEMLVAANNSASFFNMGPLMHQVLYREGTEEQRRWAEHAWENRWGGTMVLTEPDAGSDVGMGRTKAVSQPDGTWHIEGVKRFISGGDVGDTADNIFHLTLARPEGAGPGTKGLSLFVVPKYLFDSQTMELGERNGVLVTNLEHKMGIKSSPTCELTYGGDKPAIGYLVGDVHNGIAQMFKVIENARMMVGVLSAGTLSTGYLNALEYAKSRVQGADLTQMADKTAPRVTITHHPDVRRSLALQKSYAEGLRALYLYCASYQNDDVAQANFGADPDTAARVNDLLLPIVKGVASERAYETLTESLQTFGGSGYLQDYPIEQYIRDVKIDSLYEGTTAIQAQDFFFRKIVRDKGVALAHVAGLVQQFVESEPDTLKAEKTLLGAALADVQAMATALTGYLVAAAQTPEEIYKVGLGSVRFLHAVGDLVIGWRLLAQAQVAQAALAGQPAEKDRLFYAGKVGVASWFAKNQLPLLSGVRAVVENLDTDIMQLEEGAF